MRKVYVVGLGPGDSRCLTAEARSALDEAHVLCGYGVYVDLVAPLYPEKEVFTTPMTQELERCRWALESARSGRTTALVCSGDAGVYGMAGPLLELARDYPEVEVAAGKHVDPLILLPGLDCGELQQITDHLAVVIACLVAAFDHMFIINKHDFCLLCGTDIIML